MDQSGESRIADLLSDSLTQKGVQQWLHARNRYLGGARPIELLNEGDDKQAERVYEAATAWVDGTYL